MNTLSFRVTKRWSSTIILFSFVFLHGSIAGAVQPQPRVSPPDMTISEILNSKETCEECHARVSRRIFTEHKESAHGREGVGCVDCHGADHQNMPAATARKACEQCHPRETAEYLASDHSKTWENMRASARYMKQPAVVRAQGCEACHGIGAGSDDGRCDFCHNKHSFSKEQARRPEACYTCHMGPDHPQMEAYIKSKHHQTKATCTGCHFPNTHNANQNLDRLSSSPMEALCNECHEPSFNKQWLDGAEMLEKQGEMLLQQGRAIIKKLGQQGLLHPAPADREANPVEGKTLVLGGHQLYEDTSRAEKLYFEMHKYLQIHLAQGAYHQDFKMAAYKGLIPMRNYLVELEAEALLLEELAAKKESLTPITSYTTPRDTTDIAQSTYESSFHGVLPAGGMKPDCTTCHGADTAAPRAAEEMAGICGTCHTKKQTEAFSRDFAAIKNHAATLSQAARLLVEDMTGKGILKKNSDGALELNFTLESNVNQFVARTIAERFRFYLHDLDVSLKNMIIGVAHSNPDYAHWYGNAPAKSDLIEIRDAAHKLEQIRAQYGKRSPQTAR